MTRDSPVLSPALRRYRGDATLPERWTVWTPRPGDVIVCTPPKSGTTWTQAMLTMLVNGGPDLPDKVAVMSPWVDADLGVPAEDVRAALAAQPGRRVVKTHTPADGFPIWDGVTVVSVYRHPLDVFFSLRKKWTNVRKSGPRDAAWFLPVADSLRSFLDGGADPEDFDHDTLATLAMHYRETVLSGRVADLKLFHYAEMIRDSRSTVAALARAIGVEPEPALVERVAGATSFGAMKARAEAFAPVAGTGYWKSDTAFFDSASSEKWRGQLSEEDFGLYRTRLAELVPGEDARSWLENGGDPPVGKQVRAPGPGIRGSDGW